MLTPSYLAGVADDVVNLFDIVEADIKADIVKRINRAGSFDNMSQWQLWRARELGLLRGDINEVLQKALGKTQAEVDRLLIDACQRSLQYDDDIYQRLGMEPTPINESPLMRSIVLQGSRDTKMLMSNMVRTTASQSELAFINLTDKAYLKTMSGAFSINKAIREAVNELARNGLNKVAYPSGHSTSVEAAVRRAVVTGMNQTASKLQLERCGELSTDLVEVTAHAGARPSHAEWQGAIYSLSGKHPHYGDFYRETDYGSGEGLCGWNCYHSFYPYVEGVSTPTFDKDFSGMKGLTNDEDYALQQGQRHYERQVREAKKEVQTYQEAVNTAKNHELEEEYKKQLGQAGTKLINREEALRIYVRDKDLTRSRSREQVGGWNSDSRWEAYRAARDYNRGRK